MVKLTCPVEGCGKSFVKPNKHLAELALKMHDGRVHSKTIPNAVIVRNVSVNDKVKPKRKHRITSVKPTVEIGCNNCPNCGFNLRLFHASFIVANRHSR